MLYTDSKYDFLDRDNCIRFNGSAFERTYAVEMFIEENENSKTRISHKAFVKVLEVRNDAYLVSVVLWNFLINDREPDLILEQLAQKCRRPIENLEFLVNRKWQIIGLENHDLILESWQKTKKRVEQEYSGDIFDRYVSAQDQVIRNKQVLLEKLKKDVFLTQYFSPVYDSAFSNFAFSATENLKVLNLDYTVDVVFLLSDEKQHENLKILKTLDAKSPNLREMPIESYNSEYELDANSAIKSIRGKFANHGRKFSFNINQDNSAA
ncbi:hypothetical protein [Flavobacterium sp.]|uniref:hypothetical protein n=1 Tax=Flavobacterium sp. TaxID=239 RepID=UPI001216D7E5|nr:hypothetical protein [Flavobacterium sp.]RZJ70725.1 MAG: hypothetical protein EOO49_12800 [Flavobacterium sp.]